jgi:predicted solute-binding protein
LRVSAVSYLNTWPLVWGFLYGPQQGRFDFRFDLPARCAEALARGEAEIGLVPCAEIERMGLFFLPDVGIACEGPVRSILLFSKVPFEDIRTLAVDSSSRTSVALVRILLRERYGVTPVLTPQAPQLDAMMRDSDAALVIGDPALRLDPEKLPWRWLDLGSEWTDWTGLPMVFAAWAGRKEALEQPEIRDAFVESWRWGMEHLDKITARAREERGFDPELARTYLKHHIQFELTPRHREGLELFRRLVLDLDTRS